MAGMNAMQVPATSRRLVHYNPTEDWLQKTLLKGFRDPPSIKNFKQKNPIVHFTEEDVI